MKLSKKTVNFHSLMPFQSPTIPVQLEMELEEHGAEQLQENLDIATLDALEWTLIQRRTLLQVLILIM